MELKIKLRIYYTDAEVVDRGFETLAECLDYIKQEIIEKEEYADRIEIAID